MLYFWQDRRGIPNFEDTPSKEVSMAGKTDYKNNWQKENCERISLVVKKGRKATIQAHADTCGESLSGFINRAISETMERDKAAPGATE